MLPADWWIRWRDESPVQIALVQAHLLLWVGVVDQVLVANEEHGTQPQTWSGIARHIYRDRKSVARWREGDTFRHEPHAYLALASSLSIEVQRMIPSNLRWIATTIQLLCEHEFDHENCRVLAACSLFQNGPQPLIVDEEAVNSAMEAYGIVHLCVESMNTTSQILEVLSDRLQTLIASDSRK